MDVINWSSCEALGFKNYAIVYAGMYVKERRLVKLFLEK
jgi:hypothetical protein